MVRIGRHITCIFIWTHEKLPIEPRRLVQKNVNIKNINLNLRRIINLPYLRSNCRRRWRRQDGLLIGSFGCTTHNWRFRIIFCGCCIHRFLFRLSGSVVALGGVLVVLSEEIIFRDSVSLQMWTSSKISLLFGRRNDRRFFAGSREFVLRRHLKWRGRNAATRILLQLRLIHPRI